MLTSVGRPPGVRHHDPVREEVIALRKRNCSVYDISNVFAERGKKVTPAAIRDILRQEGFAPLPRRLDEERPARFGPAVQPVAEVRMFSLEARKFTTQCGGLFLFVPDLVRLNLPELAKLTGASGFVGNIQQVAVIGTGVFLGALAVFLLAAMFPQVTAKVGLGLIGRFAPKRLQEKITGMHA